ncbi:hypothetical protein SOVF_143970, partial [Spinacia oleracea]
MYLAASTPPNESGNHSHHSTSYPTVTLQLLEAKQGSTMTRSNPQLGKPATTPGNRTEQSKKEPT